MLAWRGVEEDQEDTGEEEQAEQKSTGGEEAEGAGAH